MNQHIDDDLRDRLLSSTCKGCEYSCDIKHNYCPYLHGLNEDKTICKYHHMSAYYRRKEQEKKEAEALGELIVKNGIVPKYKLGQTVYLNGYGLMSIKEKQKIRKIVVSEDGKRYHYKVTGHKDYTYNESELFETEQDLLVWQMKRFAEETIRKVHFFEKEAKKLGMTLSASDFPSLPQN